MRLLLRTQDQNLGGIRRAGTAPAAPSMDDPYCRPPRTRLGGLLLLLAALLLPPAGLVGLLVMHAVELRLDDADGGPRQVTASDVITRHRPSTGPATRERRHAHQHRLTHSVYRLT